MGISDIQRQIQSRVGGEGGLAAAPSDVQPDHVDLHEELRRTMAGSVSLLMDCATEMCPPVATNFTPPIGINSSKGPSSK